MQSFFARSLSAFPRKCVLLSALGLGGAAVLHGQTPLLHAPTAATAPSSSASSDPLALGRETPRGTVIGFIRAAQAENYDLAVQYFDVRHATVEREQEVAQQLLAILNARFGGSLDSITNAPTGLQDGEPLRDHV